MFCWLLVRLLAKNRIAGSYVPTTYFVHAWEVYSMLCALLMEANFFAGWQTQKPYLILKYTVRCMLGANFLAGWQKQQNPDMQPHTHHNMNQA
jgi:hypothetical protein